jgi:hypothetical protein
MNYSDRDVMYVFRIYGFEAEMKAIQALEFLNFINEQGYRWNRVVLPHLPPSHVVEFVFTVEPGHDFTLQQFENNRIGQSQSISMQKEQAFLARQR